ncbi:ATP transporter [Lophium mytilinum]|uniref:ATP transporter n=1 Tax=Lophium mytilinum TaxID=390894 RepID=A0A6A6QQQ0_9PEZI|nr:ATP transporter [Lophium mytilinum]
MTDSFPAADVEKNGVGSDYTHLTNNSIQTFGFEGITVTVNDRTTKRAKNILSDVNGIVKAGEILALMGPSGSGKTTLLNVLAHREATPNATVHKLLYINGKQTNLKDFQKISSYVEQEDALVGSLTVKETLYFAAKLALPSSITKRERIIKINALVTAFGLQGQADTIIGTPIQKGLSGGQKRRVSVASQLITSPKLLFLDEPTSGLDSTASYEVISLVKALAKKHNLLVIASIHQPSTTTFELFDKLLLLSRGHTTYNGSVAGVRNYFQSQGHAMPLYMNPAEFAIDLVNTDFSRHESEASQHLEGLVSGWTKSEAARIVVKDIETAVTIQPSESHLEEQYGANKLLIPLTLIHRSFIKSYRDVVAYGIRVAMYMGLAIMMGTIWLRLDAKQENIGAFTNAIFFGGAFMSFMAVAYIPAFLEDRSLYVKERANGLYGPTSFIIANFIIGLPYLFIIALLFSIVTYWLSNFRPSASGFFTWVMWLFLDLVAAESLVVLISSLVPIFVVSLAATAFANGLWMSVDGFMVAPEALNVFWRYVFHYIDYQSYVFRGMMINEFAERSYSCDSDCHCIYVSDLQDQCKIDGKAVLAAYNFDTDGTGKYVGYMLLIILGYRVLGWVVLYMRRT